MKFFSTFAVCVQKFIYSEIEGTFISTKDRSARPILTKDSYRSFSGILIVIYPSSCQLSRERSWFISTSTFTGLLLVPNGKYFGQLMGDVYPEEEAILNNDTISISTTDRPVDEADVINSVVDTASHPWGIFLTVLGTVLLDFDADACQSPSRAYLLDVCVPG